MNTIRLLALSMILTTPAFSQLPALDPEDLSKGKQLNLARIDPSLTSLTKNGNQFFNLTATRTDAAAEIQVGHEYPFANGIKNVLFVKLSAPIKKTDDRKDLADLRGLQGAAKIEAGANRLWWSPKYLVDRNLSQEDQATDLFRRWMAACTAEKVPGFDPNSGSTCGMSSLSSASQSQLIDWGPAPRLLAASAEYGSKSFQFLDATTLAQSKASHDAYAVSIAAGIFPLSGGWYYTGVTYRAERSYEGKDPSRICLPIGTGAFQCGDFALGGPEENTANIVEIEARYYLSDKIALSPKIANDFENDRRSIQVPVYFIRDVAGSLNGGISLGWRSDTKEVSATVFVGQMTSLTKRLQ